MKFCQMNTPPSTKLLPTVIGYLLLFSGILSGHASKAWAIDFVNAADYGYSPTDATAALQKAIDTKAAKVLVPKMDGEWIIGRTIRLHSDQTLVFERGVVVTAKRNAFHGKWDSLFFIDRKRNVSMVGYGAILQMQKKDYADPSKYSFAEWRHAIRLNNCRDVVIEGLTIQDTGGDGIYLGTSHVDDGRTNQNVTIKNVLLNNNYRQGISVISANGLLIDRCIFYKTNGTAPEAGIDFEPNHPFNVVRNVVIRNSIFHANRGPGVMVMKIQYLSDSFRTSGRIENCTIIGNEKGILLSTWLPNWEFRNNLIIGNRTHGMAQLRRDGVRRGGMSLVEHTAFWENGSGTTSKIKEGAGVIENVQPLFASTKIGETNYLRLAANCPEAILTGASHGGHLGARPKVNMKKAGSDTPQVPKTNETEMHENQRSES